MQITVNKINNNMISTGFKTLDSILGGWHNGDLIVIASRPGMGKTSFLCSSFQQISIFSKFKCAYFSLEADKYQFLNKFMSLYSRFDTPKITQILNAPLWIYDTPYLSFSEFKDKATDMVRNKGIKLIAIDSFQCLTWSKFNNEEYVSQKLKNIAKELNVPIIVESELTRDIDRRSDKTPNIADFKYGDSYLADAADVIAFIYRPRFYDSYEPCGDEIAEIIIAKNVHGSLGAKNLAFTKSYAIFYDLAEPQKMKYDLMVDYKNKNNMPMLIKDVLLDLINK